MSESELRLRPVTAEDTTFLLRVYASAREAEMALVPWSEEQKQAFLRFQLDAQTRDYTARHPGAEHNILVYVGRDVGRSFVARDGAAIHVLDVTVLTEARKRGAGSAFVRQAQAQATAARLPVTIYVESFNPSLQFFLKRGFKPEKEEGIHLLLKWTP